MDDYNVNDHALTHTAYWTAAVRALKHARPDRLFSDPWAQALELALGQAVGTLLRETPQFHDGRWLFIPVRAAQDAEDVKLLLQVKRRPKRAKN
jgi:O-methyltransferase involved in polyketide biosynthesis